MKFDARAKVNKEAGTKRMFSHAIFTAGRDGWMSKVDEEYEKLRPDSWKGYTIGDNTNKHLSKWPFRLDDEKIMYPFYEKLVKWSKDRPTMANVCIHKGLFPPEIEAKFPHLLEYSDARDVGKAAKDWPQLNFIIYHSAWRWTGPSAPKDAWAHFEKTGRVEWVTDLADIPGKYGVNNVYGDLGQLFAWTTTANPRLGAAVMGTLVKGLGADHVVWGTDAVWTGAPQWQIEALRRLEIPDDMRKRYGYQPLGPADGPVKTAIFGGNNARLYKFTPKQQAEVITDRVAQIKDTYEKHGPGRTNLAYGYVNMSKA
jgi:predicted TIM-barrel fold metal-dependent hydrolase